MDLTWLYIFRKKILLSRWPKLKKKKMLADLNISCCFMTLIVFRSPIFPGFRRTHIMLMTLIPKYLTLSHLVKLGHTKSIDHPSAQVLTGNTLFPISHFGLPLQVFMHKTYKLVQEFP